MKRFLIAFAAAFMVAAVYADDGKERQQLAEQAEALKESLASVETSYLDGLKNKTSAEVAKNSRTDMASILAKATLLSRMAHIKSSPGVNAVLLWRWRSAKDLCDALTDEARKVKPFFQVELEPDAGGDTALYAKRNAALFLQLPTEAYLLIKKSSR